MNMQATVSRLSMVEERLIAALESTRVLKQKAADRAFAGPEVQAELSKAQQAVLFSNGHFSALKRELAGL